MNSVTDMVLECVDSYKAQNNYLPKYVAFYRDGVGSGQHDLVKEQEIKRIKEGFEKKYGANAPKLIFMLVTKRINDRFFTENTSQGGQGRGGYRGNRRGSGGKLKNPDSGLIVNSKFTSDSNFDFFMVAQNVTQGTATPTRYEVILNESNFTADFFYTMTYFQTFNYYNWSGPVKVPAVCQYAHKLAYLLGETYGDGTKADLKNSLFYL